MFRRYPSFDQRAKMILDLLRDTSRGLSQADIAQSLQYPAKMVMEDLIRLEGRGVLLLQDEKGKLQIFKIVRR